MAGPELVVRVSANLTELKSALAEGVTQFETTRAALNQMSTAFDGNRIISQAGAVVGAILQIGDVTKLTAAEQAKANAILTEALDKYKALGREAPPGMTSLAAVLKENVAAASELKPKVDDLHTAFGAVDQVLASLGIHIGPEVKGLAELGDASGKSAAQLGLVATAGLVVGAGVAGWKIGRAISDFFDLDHVIGDATAKLLGWGDVAAQVAGNKADQLARASARVGFEVVSLTTAIEINGSAMHDWHSNADISAAVVAKWHAEIAKVKSGGEFDSLTADLKSQNFTLQDLSRRYEISVEALQLFQRETKAADEADKVATDNIKERNKFKLDHLKEELAAAAAARKLEEAASADSNVRWAATEKLRMDLSGTTTQKINADLDLWVQEQVKSHVKAKTATADFYQWLDTQRGLMRQKEEQDRLLSDSQSRESFQKRKDAADDWYRFVMDHGSSFTNADIAEALKRKDIATDEWAHWGQVSGKALDETKAKIAGVTDAARKAHDALMLMGSSMSVTAMNFDEMLGQIITHTTFSNGYMGSLDQHGLQGFEQTAHDLASKGYSFEEIVAFLKGDAPLPTTPIGPAIPGYGSSSTGGGSSASSSGRAPSPAPLPAASGGSGGNAQSTDSGAVPYGSVYGPIYKGPTSPASPLAGPPQTINLILDGRVVAQVVNDYNTADMRTSRQFPAN